MTTTTTTHAERAQAAAETAEAIAASTPRDRGSETGRHADRAAELADLAWEHEERGDTRRAQAAATHAIAAAIATSVAARREYPNR